MVREVDKLDAITVKRATKPGRYGDGGGLYLLIQASGNKSWVFRWRDRVTSKLRDKGLGPAWDVTLAQARSKAAALREDVRDGRNPIDEARERLATQRLERARTVTFRYCVERYIAAHRDGWRNAKHAGQWSATLNTYADDLMPLPVERIDTAMVVKCLEPIWQTKTETATRVRQRIETVLGWATVREYRTGDNPARWRGHLDTLLQQPGTVRTVEHMAALPHAEIGAYMAALRASKGTGARALELQVLTAMRPGAVGAACWAEIDLDAATWTIPAERMKTRKGRESGREHVVPLSPAAVRLLKSLPQSGAFVFPGAKQNDSVTTAAMLKAARSIRADVDSHGFRSTFRDWAAECTNYPRDLAEAALAHTLKDKTEAAYLRTKLIEKRRKLMNDWAKRCDQPDATTSNVVPLRAEKG